MNFHQEVCGLESEVVQKLPLMATSHQKTRKYIHDLCIKTASQKAFEHIWTLLTMPPPVNQ